MGGRINSGLVVGWLWVGVLVAGLVFWWLDWCLSEFFVVLIVGGCWGVCGGGIIFWVCDFGF